MTPQRTPDEARVVPKASSNPKPRLIGRRSAVYDFFLEEEYGKKFKCLVVNGDKPCQTKMTGLAGKTGSVQCGNLKRHLMYKHPYEYELVQMKDHDWKSRPEVMGEGGAAEAPNDDELMASLTNPRLEDEPWTHDGESLNYQHHHLQQHEQHQQPQLQQRGYPQMV